MKKETRVFWRTFGYAITLLLALIILSVGIGESRRQIRKIGFGEFSYATPLTPVPLDP